MDFTASLFNALSGDGTLTGILATFGSEPAIFSGDVLPEGFEISADPFAWIRPPYGAQNIDDFSSFSRSFDLDICFYAKSSESGALLDAAVEAARLAIHRQLLPAASGETEPFCTVTGPLFAPTSDVSIAGRRLSAHLHVRG